MFRSFRCFGLPLTLCTQGKNWVFCQSFWGSSFSVLPLSVRLHTAEFCKHAHGLLAPFALISKPTGPPPMPPLLCLNTGDRAWQVTKAWPLGFLPISFRDEWPNHLLIHAYIPLLLAQHLKWRFNNLRLGLLCLIRVVSWSLGESIKLIRKEYYLFI